MKNYWIQCRNAEQEQARHIAALIDQGYTVHGDLAFKEEKMANIYDYEIKVVPNAEPNAPGRWLPAQSRRPAHSRDWLASAELFADAVPEDHHIVAYRKAENP